MSKEIIVVSKDFIMEILDKANTSRESMMLLNILDAATTINLDEVGGDYKMREMCYATNPHLVKYPSIQKARYQSGFLSACMKMIEVFTPTMQPKHHDIDWNMDDLLNNQAE